jgi:hypothetical protein
MLKWLVVILAGAVVGSFVAVWIGACIFLGMYGMMQEHTNHLLGELDRLERSVREAIDKALKGGWN